MKKHVLWSTVTLAIIFVALVLLYITFSGKACSDENETTIEERAGIDFNQESYKQYHQLSNSPRQLTEYAKEHYSAYHQTVLYLKEIEASEGLGSLYAHLLDVLSHSNDSVEIMDIHTAFLKETISDPQLMFEECAIENTEGLSEDERAAADYLRAITYARGNFKGTLLTDEEYLQAQTDAVLSDELSEKSSERYRLLKEEGNTRLKRVVEEHPDSKAAILASIDFIEERAGFFNEPEFDMRRELYQIAVEKYPGSAFSTAACELMADAEITSSNYDNAIRFYEESMTSLDYRLSGKHSAHDFDRKLIDKLERGERPPFIITD